MVILCDTCAIIMIIRIVPDVFKDPKYECIIINEMREEIVSTRKFKEKYPWLKEYSKLIRTKATYTADSLQKIKSISIALENTRNGKSFKLSHKDQCLAATLYSQDIKELCSGDQDLRDFAEQVIDCTSLHPLELINRWIDKGIIQWDTDKHKLIEDWIADGERPQPKSAIQQFEKLTGYEYPK